MMKIKDILSIQLDNDIKNVIDLNSQSEDEIKEELDGFILTESLAGHLSDFLDKFCSDMKESGVWLSGFYGSGKRMCPRYYPIKVSYERTCFPSGSVVRNLTAMQETIPGWGRYPGGGNGHPLQYSCLENPIDRGAWPAIVHQVKKSQTRLKQLSTLRAVNYSLK